MLFDVVDVKALPKYRLWLRFEDGLEGEVDLSDLAGRGVFRRWAENPEEFLLVEIDAESGTVVWPGGLDVAPDRLYRDILRAVDKARSA